MNTGTENSLSRRQALRTAGVGALALVLGRRARAAAPARDLEISRAGDDRFDLIFTPREHRPLRILQITDTHFGSPGPDARMKDAWTRRLIQRLIDEHAPDLLVHTGDFIDNHVEGASLDAVEFMHSLQVPWLFVFGSADRGSEWGALTKDEFYRKLAPAVTGHAERDGTRVYCFRADLRLASDSRPACTLLGFDSAPDFSEKRVCPRQLAWLDVQADADRRANLDAPFVTFVHTPLAQFRDLADAGPIVGRKGEPVCPEDDAGDLFRTLASTARAKAVFCGHDHLNDFRGTWNGIELAYGRVTGWAAGADWQRGARLIEIDLAARACTHRVVLPRGVRDANPDWEASRT